MSAILDIFIRGYSEKHRRVNFSCRLTAWFREQADKGLLGEIDYEKTADGVIACKDDFTAKTFSEEDLHKLGRTSGCPYKVATVDDSSVFLVISKSDDL